MTPDLSSGNDILRQLRERYPTPVLNVRFLPGRVLLTQGAAQALNENPDADLLDYLIRHLTGDWGEIDAHDRQANEQALRNGARLLSRYGLPDNRRLWIITEADRSATTALLPEEY